MWGAALVAGFGAVAATSRAIAGLLRSAAWGVPEFSGVDVKVCGSADLQEAPGSHLTVSLYLHHVAPNASRGSQGPRVDATGRRRRPGIALELHYLLTAWSKHPETQQRLFGWCLQTLHATPTLPGPFLNHHASEPVFRPDETVELVWENMAQSSVLDIWDVARRNVQPSATYVARVIEIESAEELQEGGLVQTRDLRFASTGSR
ncbi:DUF4255 domain-containing protein [Streptomyces sp. NPDC059916]|uniref:DUF4255 domain-containing protein n=1 Tax=Streptomyces sp. NPDC059916 TaxID=3347001 RepID=UPI00368EE72E